MRRILLDNCVDHRFAAELVGHEVQHCRDLGWQLLQNGDLVQAAAKEFDLLLTVDRNMPFQTSIRGLDIGVIILRPKRNRLDHLKAMLPGVLKAILDVKSGEYLEVLPTAH